MFALDKERSADIVDFVTTIARYSNGTLGAMVSFHVLIVENMEPVLAFVKAILDSIADVLDGFTQLIVQAYRSVERGFQFLVGLVFPYLELIARAIRDGVLAIRPFLRRAYAAIVAQVVTVYRTAVNLLVLAGRAIYSVAQKAGEMIVMAGAAIVYAGTLVVQWTIDLARRLNVRYYYEQVLLNVKAAADQVWEVGVMLAVQFQTALHQAFTYVTEAAVIVGQWLYEAYKTLEAAVDAVIDRIEAFIINIANIFRPYIRGVVNWVLAGVAHVVHYVAIATVWLDAHIGAVTQYLTQRLEAFGQVVAGLHALVVDTLDQALQIIGLSVRVFSVVSGGLFMAASLAIHAQMLTVAACIPLFFTRTQGFLGISMMLTVPFLYSVPPGTYQYLLPTFM